MRKFINNFIFIKRSRKIHKDLYNYSKTIYINPKTKVEIICPTHGSFWQLPYHHMRGHGCKHCSHRAPLTTKDFIERSKIKHNNKYDYSNSDYKSQKLKVKINCPTHGQFEQYPNHHMRGRGCQACQTAFNIKDTKDFIKKAHKIQGYEYDYSKAIFKDNKTKIKIICKKHGIFRIIASLHLKGTKCGKCHLEKLGKSRIISKKDFIERAKKIHGNRYDYSKYKHKKGTQKVCIICTKHGEFQQRVCHHLDGIGCPLCVASKGELAIEKFLTENKIKFIPQYKNKKCRDKNVLPFDFYLPQQNICIEYDGEQHFKENVFKDLDLKSVKHHDKIKTNFCKNNKIKLIRIPYWKQKSIEKILKRFIHNEFRNNP